MQLLCPIVGDKLLMQGAHADSLAVFSCMIGMGRSFGMTLWFTGEPTKSFWVIEVRI